jgi:hypothetical protein
LSSTCFSVTLPDTSFTSTYRFGGEPCPKTSSLDGGGACVPTTCADQNVRCGGASDGCGGTLDCGPCACSGSFTMARTVNRSTGQSSWQCQSANPQTARCACSPGCVAHGPPLDPYGGVNPVFECVPLPRP